MEIKDNEKSSDQPFVDMANRGISFTLILVVLTIAAIAMVVVYGLSWQRLIFQYPRWSAYCLLIASLLRLLAIAGIWRWKKIAVILYSLIAMATTVIWFAVGEPVQSIFGMIGAILVASMSTLKWSRMSWKLMNSQH
ncbi:hypothetical protein ACO0LL_26225 [Undibacterium sp. TC4M20W]|uniref:hypothetical protein n=1 Tax=Undibacterium sp. TC4M20W TaxID=3413052 RepID=UPI003BF27F0B